MTDAVRDNPPSSEQQPSTPAASNGSPRASLPPAAATASGGVPAAEPAIPRPSPLNRLATVMVLNLLAPVVALALFKGFQDYRSVYDQTYGRLERWTAMLADVWETSDDGSPAPMRLARVTARMTGDHPEVEDGRSVGLLSPEGAMIASSAGDGSPVPNPAGLAARLARLAGDVPATLAGGVVTRWSADGDAESLTVLRPTSSPTAPVLAVRFDATAAGAEFRRRFATLAAMDALLATLVGVLAYVLVWRFVIRPVERLHHGAALVAAGRWDHRLPVESDDELGLLAAEFNQMAARLAEGYRGLEAVNRRMTHDRAFAGRLQRRMLPAALPTAGPFRFAVEYRPCEDLGGDFYDVFPLNGRRERGDRGDSADPDSPDTPVAMYVADVSGHGIGAALITVFVREAIARLRDRGDRGHAVLMSPSAVLSALRSRFAEEDFGTLFVTMIYGVLDPRTGRFRFASAGHPMPMGEWDGVVGEIPGDTGPVIGGFLPEMPFPEHEIEVPAAGRLLLYTDGLTDAVGDDGRALGPERLRRMLAEGAGRSGRDWMALSSAALSAHVGSRPPTDDVTLLAVTAEGAKCGVRSAKPERMAEADSVAEAERTAALVEERT